MQWFFVKERLTSITKSTSSAYECLALIGHPAYDLNLVIVVLYDLDRFLAFQCGRGELHSNVMNCLKN